MSDTPEGNICKVSANLGWASDTLAMVDKTMLKLSAEVKTILRERDNLQDQRDFAMSEIERLRKERDEAREECAAMQNDAKDYIELADELDAVKRERDEAREALLNLSALVRRLFALLETVEVSDSEREFHPTVIRSCRVAHTSELAELLPQIKEALK